MRTANPALNAKTFKNFPATLDADQAMTIQGTVNKTVIMLVLLIISASWTWGMFYSSGNAATVTPWMMGGAIGGFIVAMITLFKKHWAGITAPIYAILEGLFLGGISAVFESMYPGIVMQAVRLHSALCSACSLRINPV